MKLSRVIVAVGLALVTSAALLGLIAERWTKTSSQPEMTTKPWKPTPKRNGLIAFASAEIVVVRPDGSGRRQLTRSRYEVAYPLWSPDGTRLLFHRGVGEAIRVRHLGVWVIDADGTHERRVLLDPRSDDDNVGEAVWSQDGREIAFERNNDLYVMNADGTNVRRVGIRCEFGCAIWDIALSPDGRRFAVVEHDDIRVIDVDGDGDRRIVSDNVSGELAWSPDGARLLFTDEAHRLAVVNADGSGLRTLTHIVGGEDHEPSWSPDGRRILFTRWRVGDWRIALRAVNADGSGLRRLDDAGRDGNPTWSPDWKKIAFVREYEDGPGGMYVINADGSGARRLTREDATPCCPAWQPVQLNG